MNIKKIYIDFRKNFYINKLENLLNDDNKISELIKTNNSYDIEFARKIINEFIENSIFNTLYDKNVALSNETIHFILFNGIDKVFFDNILIFKEDIDFMRKYKKLMNKISKI